MRDFFLSISNSDPFGYAKVVSSTLEYYQAIRGNKFNIDSKKKIPWLGSG